MRLALRFISGKYTGGEYPLEEGREIVVGRSSDLEMVLVEEMVSRKHARIEMTDGTIGIEDLGSTNGTFVNGERITKASLSLGDRVLIGSNILKVVEMGDGAGASTARKGEAPSGPKGMRPREVSSPEGEAPRMTGNIEEIPLPDLLQLFGTSKKNGVLVVETESAIGRIFLKQGIIHYATIESFSNEQVAIPPEKAVQRMLHWPRGVFELEPPDPRVFENPLDAPVQGLLMEAFRQKDEFERIVGDLPPRDAGLALAKPLEAKLRDLDDIELDMLQLAVNSGSVASMLDESQVSDLQTAEALIKLIEKGYLKTTE